MRITNPSSILLLVVESGIFPQPSSAKQQDPSNRKRKREKKLRRGSSPSFPSEFETHKKRRKGRSPIKLFLLVLDVEIGANLCERLGYRH